MAFTDEQIERLKEEISHTDDGSCHQVCLGCGIDMRAILARLEAAERVIATEPNWIGPGRMAYKAWLKSAGREGR